MTASKQIRNGAFDRLVEVYVDRHPSDVARDLERAPAAESAKLLESVTATRAREVMRRLTPATATDVLRKMGMEDAAALLVSLAPNRSAALLARVDADHRDRLLAQMEESTASELREMMAYPPDSAGSLMDPKVATFRPDAVASDAVRRLRALRRRRIQDVFVVDEDDHLLGSVPIQDVFLAEPGTRLDSLVTAPPPSVTAFAPQEEILETLESSRAQSLPVVNFDGCILGVLRQNQMIAAAQMVGTDDLVSMVGAGKDERALSPPLFAVRKRLPWLEINLLTAFLAASVVGIFESTIARNTALAVLLPVVAGQSGNTGAQALAVTMRGLALREIRLRNWLRVTGKEVLVGVLNGVAVAATTSAAVYFWSRSEGLAIVIGVSMILSMTAAGLAGAIIPLVLTRLRQDPAQSSSIILTTVTDVVGFFSFLGIATLLSAML
jgi:magnesium transporter